MAGSLSAHSPQRTASPLSRQALGIIDELKSLASTSEFLFLQEKKKYEKIRDELEQLTNTKRLRGTNYAVYISPPKLTLGTKLEQPSDFESEGGPLSKKTKQAHHSTVNQTLRNLFKISSFGER